MASARRLRRGDAIVRFARFRVQEAPAQGCIARHRCRTFNVSQVPDQLALVRGACPPVLGAPRLTTAHRAPSQRTATVLHGTNLVLACITMHTRAARRACRMNAAQTSPTPAGWGASRESRKVARCLHITSQQVPERVKGDPAAGQQRSARQVSNSGQRRPPSLASCKLESRDAFFICRGSWCNQRTQ